MEVAISNNVRSSIPGLARLSRDCPGEQPGVLVPAGPRTHDSPASHCRLHHLLLRQQVQPGLSLPTELQAEDRRGQDGRQGGLQVPDSNTSATDRMVNTSTYPANFQVLYLYLELTISKNQRTFITIG